MPTKNRRSQGQKRRQDRETNLPPDERSKLLNELSQTPGAIAARSARPREDLWTSTHRKRRVQVRVLSPPIDRCRRSPTLSARAQAWLTHADDAPKRQGPLRKLPSDILTVER